VGGDVANMAKYIQGIIRNSEGWRPLGRVRCRCEHNLKDCNKVGWVGVEWICLAWDRDKW